MLILGDSINRYPLPWGQGDKNGQDGQGKNREAKMIIEKILERYNLPDVFEVDQEELQKIRSLVIITQSVPPPIKTKFRREDNA